jgi:hypothetical protein
MGCGGAFLADADTIDVDMGDTVSSVSDHRKAAGPLMLVARVREPS